MAFHSSNSPSIVAHNELAETSTPYQYDGNPKFLRQYENTLRNYIAKEKITTTPPMRPFCMRDRPPNVMLDPAETHHRRDFNEVVDYNASLQRFLQGQVTHLSFIKMLNAPHVFQEFRSIFEHPTHSSQQKIIMILAYQKADAATKQHVSVQQLVQDLNRITFATSFSDALSKLTQLELCFDHLEVLNAPRSPHDKKLDFRRVISDKDPNQIFKQLNFVLDTTKQHDTYEEWKLFFKTLKTNMDARQTDHDILEHPPKRTRLDEPQLNTIASETPTQINSVSAFANDFLSHLPPGASVHLPNGSIWATISTSNPQSNSQRPNTTPKNCWNCRMDDCPGNTNPRLCIKPYCRICDYKEVLDNRGIKDCQWTSHQDPRYHLPHQCVHCPPRYKQTTKSAGVSSTPRNSTPIHPTPYAKTPQRQLARGYIPPASSAHINMADAISSEPCTDDPFQALMAESYDEHN